MNSIKKKNDKLIARKKVRNFILGYKKTHPCVICGESRVPCLDFHHKNRGTKTFEISGYVRDRSIKTIKIEILKCVILCANCHRMLHYSERE